MGSYRIYNFMVRESEDTKPFLNILDSVINTMKKEGFIKEAPKDKLCPYCESELDYHSSYGVYICPNCGWLVRKEEEK